MGVCRGAGPRGRGFWESVGGQGFWESVGGQGLGGGTLTSRVSSSSCARFARRCFLSFLESPEGALCSRPADQQDPRVSTHASHTGGAVSPKSPPTCWYAYLIGQVGHPSHCSGGGAPTGLQTSPSPPPERMKRETHTFTQFYTHRHTHTHAYQSH